ncbi:hypothetical protein ST47_g9253 [Ascochyta rabiei]|uniref:Uncharacterized protein n=1 Tax=Didymella rabiei TaxID=5454 RepID=A0A162XXD5_DIDRA|nr:hypothetical protein ST47_g9253 [Ascochyta rabiei]
MQHKAAAAAAAAPKDSRRPSTAIDLYTVAVTSQVADPLRTYLMDRQGRTASLPTSAFPTMDGALQEVQGSGRLRLAGDAAGDAAAAAAAAAAGLY